jgi:hypothetical protein
LDNNDDEEGDLSKVGDNRDPEWSIEYSVLIVRALRDFIAPDTLSQSNVWRKMEASRPWKTNPF